MVLYKDGKRKVIPLPDPNMMVMTIVMPDDIVVLNKPAGLPVHVGPKVSQSLTDYLHYWQYEQADAPLLAHRLDK